VTLGTQSLHINTVEIYLNFLRACEITMDVHTPSNRMTFFKLKNVTLKFVYFVIWYTICNLVVDNILAREKYFINTCCKFNLQVITQLGSTKTVT
jgi:hypothetical protein